MNTTDPYDSKDVADNILEEWDDIVLSLDFKHLLAFGTCLGFYRDGGYIEGDNDIDVWIKPDNLKLIMPKMLERGYTLGRKAHSQHFFKNNILLDVWLIPKAYHEPYDIIEYNSRKYNAPNQVENYLEVLYGDWKTPSNKDANWRDLGKLENKCINQ